MDISFKNIEFAYNGKAVLKDLNSKIKDGDFVALVGPNGSGKSTLLKCINGILRVRKGSIEINKKSIDNYRTAELAESIAYVPQTEKGISNLTVFDTVLMGRKPYIRWKPTKSDINFVADLLEEMKLDDIAMREINKLSGGQRQSVFIARALAQKPDILLLDEPTSNLDIKHQIEVMEYLKELNKKGITIVIALHDINLAAKYVQTIIMLKEGRIFSTGGRETITSANMENLYGIKVEILNHNSNMVVMPHANL